MTADLQVGLTRRPGTRPLLIALQSHLIERAYRTPERTLANRARVSRREDTRLRP